MGVQHIYPSHQGENHHCAKLTTEKVKAMRALKEEKDLCIRCIAIMYGVAYGTAWDALTYVTWKHIK